MPGSADPEEARAALLLVNKAVEHLRGDLGATVLCAALAKIGLTRTPQDQSRFQDVCASVLQSCMLKGSKR